MASTGILFIPEPMPRFHSMPLVPWIAVGVRAFVALTAVAIAPSPSMCAAQVETPETLAWSAASLVAAKRAWLAGDVSVAADVRAIVAQAERDLAEHKIESVVSSKTAKTPAGIDPHDYFSVPPYWWPNPDTPDGLPYVARDGRRSPEFWAGNYKAMSTLAAVVPRLALAWWFTGDERFAAHASTALRVWFLDTETRMNPNFRHAQTIPGVAGGRAVGLIDAVRFLDLIEGALLLKGSPTWSEADDAGLRAWFSDFLEWCVKGEFSEQLSTRTHNNIGTWYFAQIAGYAAYCGRLEELRPLLEQRLPALVSRQFDESGQQPDELSRTRPMHYSTYNLHAWVVVGSMASRIGLDVWSGDSETGRSLRSGLYYLAGYADPDVEWPHKDIDARPREQLASLLLAARRIDGVDTDPVMCDALAKVEAAHPAPVWMRLAHAHAR